MAASGSFFAKMRIFLLKYLPVLRIFAKMRGAADSGVSTDEIKEAILK